MLPIRSSASSVGCASLGFIFVPFFVVLPGAAHEGITATGRASITAPNDAKRALGKNLEPGMDSKAAKTGLRHQAAHRALELRARGGSIRRRDHPHRPRR